MAQNATADVTTTAIRTNPRRAGMIWFGFAGVLVLGWLQFSITQETASDIEILGADGTAGSALIVYHPGMSDLQERLTAAFARGLRENEWHVARTTTSSTAPTDLSNYDLLVLGVHTYWWSPDRPTQRYLARIGDLGGKPTVALLSGLGATGRSERLTREQIEAVNGEVVSIQPFWVMRPNYEDDNRPNDEVAMEMAYQHGVATAERLR